MGATYRDLDPTQLRSQNLNFKVVHVRCINCSTYIFAFFSILNYPVFASSYVYYFYFNGIEIIEIKSTPDRLVIIIISHSTGYPDFNTAPLFLNKFIMSSKTDSGSTSPSSATKTDWSKSSWSYIDYLPRPGTLSLLLLPLLQGANSSSLNTNTSSTSKRWYWGKSLQTSPNLPDCYFKLISAFSVMS